MYARQVHRGGDGPYRTLDPRTPIGEFVEWHPTVKMLALGFLLLIGMTLVADGSGLHIPKGYIYFAMGFSVFVEFLNLRMHKERAAVEPVQLHRSIPGD